MYLIDLEKEGWGGGCNPLKSNILSNTVCTLKTEEEQSCKLLNSINNVKNILRKKHVLPIEWIHLYLPTDCFVSDNQLLQYS